MNTHHVQTTIAICLLCAACTSFPRQYAPEEIQEIRMLVRAHHGYLSAVSVSDMRITRQRIRAELVMTDTQGKSEPETRGFDMETPENLWRHILQGCALSSLERVERGRSTLVPGDGEDITFTVTTGQREFSFLNGHGEAYKQLEQESPCLYTLHCVHYHTLRGVEIPPETLEKACIQSSQ
ncbi:MAG: hypothetical protein LBU11_02670 [Zoogloeaceae bacterium]|jgi:hypothetical protein|nr:hypothetical protein [Zoogloeaceae bacterium]